MSQPNPELCNACLLDGANMWYCIKEIGHVDAGDKQHKSIPPRNVTWEE